MDLILWRHAEAQEPEGDMTDLDRALTRRGDKQAARMAAIFARDSANIARVNIVPGGNGTESQMIISAMSAEQGDNVSALDVQMEGAPIEIAFNARYLVEALSVITSAQVQLDTRDPSSPGVLRPVGDPDFVHIVMPMHVAR